VSSVLIAILVAVLTFGSGILGLYFQKRLPTEHMSGGSRDMILGVIGLVTLLLALVLGTLVGNTYAFFANQKSELETYASRAVLLDRALARYGPEAKPVRDQLKAALTESYELFWKAAEIDPKQLGVEVAVKRYEPIGDSIAALNPLTAAQKEALSAANLNLGLMEQTRILMSLQLASPISWSLVFIVVAWSMFLSPRQRGLRRSPKLTLDMASKMKTRGGEGRRAAGSNRGNAGLADGGSPQRHDDLRQTPRPCRDDSARGQRPKCLQQAGQDVHSAGRGAQAISKRRRAEDDRSARPCRRGRPGDRRQCQRSNRGGRGTEKIGGTTPCSWTCSERRDAKPNRSGAGCGAVRQPFGDIASAGCTGPLAPLPRATGTR
jgi:hypothetical protein